MKDRHIGSFWVHVCFGEYSYAGFERWKWLKRLIHIKVVYNG